MISNSAQGSGETQQGKSPKTSRGTGRQKVKTEEDVLRNRLIQAKYRERVKERKEQLATQYETACQDLQRERLQREALAAENSTLEAVLSLREDWTAALEEAGTPNGNDVRAPDAPHSVLHSLLKQYLGGATSDHRSASTSGSSMSFGTTISTPGGVQPPATAAPEVVPVDAEPAPPAAAPPMLALDTLTVAAARIGKSLTAAARDKGEQAYTDKPKPFRTLEVLSGIQVDPEVIELVKSSTLEQFIRSWVDSNNRTRDLLSQYEMTNSESSHAELKLHLDQWGLLHAVALLHKPSHLQCLMATQLGGVLSPEEECARWDALLVSLGLTLDQQQRYLQMLADYERQVELLQQHREQALQLIRQGSAAPVSPEQLQSLGLTPMMAAYLEMWEGLGALHAYPDLVFFATLQLFGFIVREWTPLQRARLQVAAAPNFPDILGLLHAIQRAAGPSSAVTEPSS